MLCILAYWKSGKQENNIFVTAALVTTTATAKTDTLESIAKRIGTSVGQILVWTVRLVSI